MPDPVACWNGKVVPAHKVSVSIADIGFLQGVTVTEMLRTFRGELFEVEPHLDRFNHSLTACSITLPETREDLKRLLKRVTKTNYQSVKAGGELAVCVFATPGVNPVYSPVPVKRPRPTLCIHSFTITAERWGRAYVDGLSLMTSSVRQIPVGIVDPVIKSRSRLHWHLAAMEVKERDPAAMAALLDEKNFLTETAVGNIFALTDEGLFTPRRTKTLPGISQQYVIRLAAELGMPCTERDLNQTAVRHAREVWLTCTTGCILPVTHFDGRPIGDGRPGRVYRRLLQQWSERVGVKIDGDVA
jgi:branched-chain amino acid aminotransferase